MNDEVPSLSDLMNEAYRLSLDLSYESVAPDMSYLHPRKDWRGVSTKKQDTVYAWSDGLVHKMYQNVSTGHCSLQAMIDFSIAAFEASVKKDIAMMKALLTKLPAPIQYTFAMMQAEGYRGRWAGLPDEPLTTA